MLIATCFRYFKYDKAYRYLLNFTYNEIAGSCDGDITFPPHFGVISIRKDRSHVPCVGINDLYVQDPRGAGKVVHEGETEHGVELTYNNIVGDNDIYTGQMILK